MNICRIYVQCTLYNIKLIYTPFGLIYAYSGGGGRMKGSNQENKASNKQMLLKLQLILKNISPSKVSPLDFFLEAWLIFKRSKKLKTANESVMYKTLKASLLIFFFIKRLYSVHSVYI